MKEPSKQRRWQIAQAARGRAWDSVDWQYCNRAIAEKLRCSVSTVLHKRHALKLPNGLKGRKTWPKKFSHAAIKWKETDAWNAKNLGVSRERIRQLRAAKGLPSSRTIKRYYGRKA